MPGPVEKKPQKAEGVTLFNKRAPLSGVRNCAVFTLP